MLYRRQAMSTRMTFFASLRMGSLVLFLLSIAIISGFAEAPPISSTVHPDPNSAEASSAEELDRPGEVENPFALPLGETQIVSYVLFANAAAREDEDFGMGGSATVFQTGVRFGAGSSWEAQFLVDTFIQDVDKGNDGDDPGQSRAGLAFLTIRAKVQILGESSSEAGLALVPFVRIPVSRSLSGQTEVQPGLIVPFDLDLDHGCEIEGSTGVSRSVDEGGSRTVDLETQASIEWHFAPRWTVYAEPEIEIGETRPRWAIEQGLTYLLTRRLQVDVGINIGLRNDSRARFVYMGAGWNL
jgi:hypothetical protein